MQSSALRQRTSNIVPLFLRNVFLFLCWKWACFRYCWTALSQHQGFGPLLLLSVSWLGMHRYLGGDTDSWPQLTKGIMQTSVVLNNKSWGKERTRRDFQNEGICLLKSPLCDGVLLVWRWLNTCLTKRNTELVPRFYLLECMAFPLPIKLLSQPMTFLSFSHLILLLILLEGESYLGGADLLAGVKLSQAVLHYEHTCNDVS